MAQKKRTQKTSQGVHGGGGKHPGLTRVELVNLGKGPFERFKPVGEDRSTQGR